MSDHVSARFVSIATATGDAGASLEMVMPMETPTLFISYSHQDEAWKDRLQKQLAFLKIRLTSWDDRNISGGADWKSEIHEAMNQANLAILLVTPDFLCSEFIKTVEVPRLLERHRSGNLRLYPIIVSHCAFKRVDWLAALQCRPKDGQPLDKFFEESVVRGNEQLAMIADEIAGLLGASDEEMDEEVEAEATDDPLRLFAELVKKSGGVAKPPQDLDAAIQSGLTDIAETLSGLTARSRSTGTGWLMSSVSSAPPSVTGLESITIPTPAVWAVPDFITAPRRVCSNSCRRFPHRRTAARHATWTWLPTGCGASSWPIQFFANEGPMIWRGSCDSPSTRSMRFPSATKS